MKPLASILIAAALVAAAPAFRPSTKTQVAGWMAYYAVAAPKPAPAPVPVPPKPEKPATRTPVAAAPRVELNAFGLPVGMQPEQTMRPLK